MLVLVGSKNAAKLQAVESAFKQFVEEVEVKGVSVETGVEDQPMTLGKTVQGAINRAKDAWGECDYSVGIESGIFEVPGTKSGYMDTTANAVFDGKRVYLGLGPCFEYPLKVLEKILKEGKEVSDVLLEEWGEDTRDEQGAIGRLSLGKMPRNKLHEAGLIMALMQVFNKKLYSD